MEVNDFTLLEINGIGIAPYSARGLTQTLDPIAQSVQLRRTVNGALRDISFPSFFKYRSTISCGDMQTPALDGIMPGLQVIVDCVAELSFKTAGGAPARSVVPGSLYTVGEFTFYRPRLTMLVGEYTVERDEFGRVVNWSLTLEEI